MPRKDSALETYEGSCPICGLKLFLSADGKVVCLDGHYTAYRGAFEQIWSAFQKITPEAINEAATSKLFAGLDALNQVEIAPEEVARLRQIAIKKDD
jgi:uncharacterized Zn finger protein (UPF0148 family)